MSLDLNSVVNSSTPQGEFVWIEVLADCNLSNYAIIDRTFDVNQRLSNEFRHIFIFPNLNVKKGDWLKLCTGAGTYSSQKITDRSIGYLHNFFWNSGNCVWNNSGGDTASLIKFQGLKKVTVPKV